MKNRCVVNYNTWDLTHLVTGLCFESCSRTLDEAGVFSIFVWRILDLDLDFCSAKTSVWRHSDCTKQICQWRLNPNFYWHHKSGIWRGNLPPILRSWTFVTPLKHLKPVSYIEPTSIRVDSIRQQDVRTPRPIHGLRPLPQAVHCLWLPKKMKIGKHLKNIGNVHRCVIQ